MTPEQIKKTKAFQDWMDVNHPNWVGCTDSACTNGKNLNRGNGYGNFGTSTRKVWNLYGNNFNSQYNPQSDASTQTSTPSQSVDVEKELFDDYHSEIIFYSVNKQIFRVVYNKVIEKWLKYFRNKNFNEPTSYVGSVLAAYGNNISKYVTDENTQTEIDKQLPNLQSYLKTLFEGIQIKRVIGLSQILEQISNLVTVNVVNGIPQKQTPKSADGPSTEGPPTGPLIEPKKTTPPVPPPPSGSTKPNDGEKVTQQEVQQTLQNNVNIKEIKKYSDRIKTTETPRYEACDNLFDNYESQLKLLKRQIEQGLIEPPKGDEPILQDIKTKLKWCYTSSEGKLRFKFKFNQMSSLRDENIKNAKGEQIPNPFKVNI